MNCREKAWAVLYAVWCAILVCIHPCGLEAGGFGPSTEKNSILNGIQINNWRPSGNRVVYRQADLYGHINGGAEIFLEYGFEQLEVQNYRSRNEDLSAEVYRMTDTVAALGIYLMKSGPETQCADFGERHTTNRYQWMFYKGPYFVILNNPEGKEALAPAMLGFAQAIAGRVPIHPPFDPFDSLPKDKRVPYTQRILRGPLALQSLYTFGEGDILQIKKADSAVSSDYRSKEGEQYRHIRIRYATVDDARLVFQGVRRGLDPYLTVIEEKPAGLIFQDFAKKYGEIINSENLLTIRVHLDCPSP